MVPTRQWGKLSKYFLFTIKQDNPNWLITFHSVCSQSSTQYWQCDKVTFHCWQSAHKCPSSILIEKCRKHPTCQAASVEDKWIVFQVCDPSLELGKKGKLVSCNRESDDCGWRKGNDWMKLDDLMWQSHIPLQSSLLPKTNLFAPFPALE